MALCSSSSILGAPLPLLLSLCLSDTPIRLQMQTMVVGRAGLAVSPRLSITILILVLLLLLFPPSASHGTSWRAGENTDTAPSYSEITEGNRNTEMARDPVVGGHSRALDDVGGSARQVPTGPDPLHHRRKPVSP